MQIFFVRSIEIPGDRDTSTTYRESLMFSGRLGRNRFNPCVASGPSNRMVVINPDNIPLDYTVFRGPRGETFPSAESVVKFILNISRGYWTTTNIAPKGKRGISPFQ